MSFDKAIQYGKTKRKQYKKLAPRIDKTCRCHGSCEYCQRNRMYQINKEKDRTNMLIKEYKTNCEDVSLE